MKITESFTKQFQEIMGTKVETRILDMSQFVIQTPAPYHVGFSLNINSFDESYVFTLVIKFDDEKTAYDLGTFDNMDVTETVVTDLVSSVDELLVKAWSEVL